MLEKYYKYKIDYKNYLILIKCGNFYECINKDALIINKLFKYKVVRLSNNLKAGFPINALDKVLIRLDKEKINYIIIENKIKKKNFFNNNYLKYEFSDDIF